jgi:crossover junction endodeoxyribonuclease RuvC
MTIIGIDPGSVSCGFGIIEFSNYQLSLVDTGLIKPKSHISNSSFIDRLKYLYDAISKVIRNYDIDETAVETQFYHNNAQSLMKLTQARTSVELAALNLNIPVFEYSPLEIKLSVTVRGNAT